MNVKSYIKPIKLILISHILIICSCVAGNKNIHRSISSTEAISINSFDVGKVKSTIDKFNKHSGELIYKNTTIDSGEEYSGCNKSEQGSEALKVYTEILNNVNKSNKQISLKKCNFDSHFVAFVQRSSIYYDNSSIEELKNKFKEKTSQVLTLILAHEMGHFIHEYSTQERVSGLQGLSLSGTVARYQHSGAQQIDAIGQVSFNYLYESKEFKDKICTKNNGHHFLRNNSNVKFDSFDECINFSFNSEHDEVDAIGLSLARKVMPKIDLSLSIDYLKYYAQQKKLKDKDPEFHKYVDERLNRRAELLKSFIEKLNNY